MKLKIFFLFQFLFGQALFLFAQNNSSATPKPRIAIFAPLYLDSAFDAANNYRYGTAFPRFINPGIEFYEGAQLALDSLNMEGHSVEVFIYDSRNAKKNLDQQLQEAGKDSVQLIIAYSETVSELQHFASSAQLMQIPFINANLPNDGGVYSNPFFVVLNPTLRTHVESIYRYIQKYHSLENIIVFRKKGQLEDIIKNYLEEAGKNTASVPLKLKYVDLIDTFSLKQLQSHLDSNVKTICIAGSLDENFGKRLCTLLASIDSTYPLTLMGMPTFDNLDKEFSRPDYKGLEIIYSTPFYNPRTDKISQHIISLYSAKMNARPSDMVLRGYETIWRFAKLLLQYKNEIATHLSVKTSGTFYDFDIQPALNKKNMTLDYFENKKLYFIKWLDGMIKNVE
jgi:ABC-type branched-subunit amino acid transport system substrate-binding protein